MNTDTTAHASAPRKRRSGARNADALYKAWLHRHRIPVEGAFVAEWIKEAIELFRTEHDAGVERCAEHLRIDKQTLINARNGRSRPVITWFMMVAELLGRQQELEQLLPEPGKDDWGPIGTRYCGDGHSELKGCGSHFHPHHEGGLCKECHDGADDPDFVPRDVKMANNENRLATYR